MKIIVKSVLFIFCIQFSVFTYGQSEIGISGGALKSGFYDNYRSSDFNGSYKPYWSYTASVYYKEPVSAKLYAGFELEEMHVKSNLKYSKAVGMTHVFTYDALLDLDYINFHFLFGGKLFSIKETAICATLSPYYGYLVHSRAVGYGTKSVPFTYTDSLGTHNIMGDERYDINETQTKEMHKANIGLSLKLDATIPIHAKLALLFRTSYNLGIYSVVREDPFIGIRGYAFSIGIIYKLDKKYLHFSEWDKYAKPATQR